MRMTKRPALILIWLICVLVMSALVPRGYMVAPSAAHGFEITLCPQTNSLARAAPGAGQASEAKADAHALMGHTQAGKADDSAGHSSKDAPAAAKSGGDCAFAGAGTAGIASEPVVFEPALQAIRSTDSPTYRRLAVRRQDRLRPPLRAPPAAG